MNCCQLHRLVWPDMFVPAYIKTASASFRVRLSVSSRRMEVQNKAQLTIKLMYSFSPFSPYKLSSQWPSCEHDTFLLTKRERSAANRWYFEPGSILLDILFTVCCLLLTLPWYRLLFIACKVVSNYRRNDCGEISNLWPFTWNPLSSTFLWSCLFLHHPRSSRFQFRG